MLEFEWNIEKAGENLRNHGVSFDEATTAFGEPLSLTISDPEHSAGGYRYLLLGMSSSGCLLVISHTYREQ